MYTNTNCTIYAKTDSDYRTIHIPACYWQEVRAQEVKKYGAENADSVKVVIPLSSLSGYGTEWTVPEGSWIIKGLPAAVVTDDISVLIGAGLALFSVSSVSDHLSGSEDVRHITIGAK